MGRTGRARAHAQHIAGQGGATVAHAAPVQGMGHHQVAAAQLAGQRRRRAGAQIHHRHAGQAQRARQQDAEQKTVHMVGRHRAQDAPASGQQARQGGHLLPQQRCIMQTIAGAPGAARGREAEFARLPAQAVARRCGPLPDGGQRMQLLQRAAVLGRQRHRQGARQLHQFQRVRPQVLLQLQSRMPWQGPGQGAAGPQRRQLGGQQIARMAQHGVLVLPPLAHGRSRHLRGIAQLISFACSGAQKYCTRLTVYVCDFTRSGSCAN